MGNGLISSAFLEFKDDDNTIILASGVSNSRETNYEEYKREMDLISSFIGTKSKVVYFSSISIFDQSLDTMYVNYKKFIENMISNNFENYLIFRLPIIIGKSNNNNTFVNKIKSKILNDEQITVYNKSSIYMIDIDDIKERLPSIIKSQNKEIINVTFDNKESVLNIIETMETLLGHRTNKEIIDKGFDFTINPLFNDHYDNKDILKKYLS